MLIQQLKKKVKLSTHFVLKSNRPFSNAYYGYKVNENASSARSLERDIKCTKYKQIETHIKGKSGTQASKKIQI